MNAFALLVSFAFFIPVAIAILGQVATMDAAA